MSDYLNNLLTRSRNLAAEVRPRLAHPFESFGANAPAAPPLDEMVSESAAVSESYLAENSFTGSMPESTATGSRLAPHAHAPTADSSSPSARVSHPPEMRFHEAASPARAGSAQERTEGEPVSAEFRSSPATVADQTEARRTSRRDGAFQSQRDEAIVTEPAQPPPTPPASQPARINPALPSEATAQIRSVPTQNAADAPTLLHNTGTLISSNMPLLAGRDSTRDASSRQSAPQPLTINQNVALSDDLTIATRPPDPPTVHVTIGRIEVRAVMPPAETAKRGTRAVPKLSLDEYLRSQNGGKR